MRHNSEPMEKLQLYKIAIALLLALNLGTLAFMWLNRPPHPGQKGPYQFLVKATDMDKTQQAAYTQLRDAHRSKMDAFRAENSQIRSELFNLLAQKDQNAPEVLLLTNSIAAVKRQEELLTFEHFRRVREICRPEQQVKFDAAIGEAIQSMGPPRPRQ